MDIPIKTFTAKPFKMSFIVPHLHHGTKGRDFPFPLVRVGFALQSNFSIFCFVGATVFLLSVIVSFCFCAAGRDLGGDTTSGEPARNGAATVLRSGFFAGFEYTIDGSFAAISFNPRLTLKVSRPFCTASRGAERLALVRLEPAARAIRCYPSRFYICQPYLGCQMVLIITMPEHLRIRKRIFFCRP